MKKEYKMIDQNNNVFITTYKTARRFFQLHGGNRVLIIDSDGKEETFENLPDGRIISLG